MSSTLTLRSKIEEDHLTCTVCMCHFDKPKALPCLHTFCEGCLRDFVYGRCYEQHGKFPCPICRVETEIPNGGIQNYPDNHLLNSLLDTVTSSRKVPKIPPKPTSCLKPTSNSEHCSQILVSTKTNRTTPLYPDLTSITSQKSHDVIPQQSHVLACSNGMILRFGKYGPGLVDFFKPIGLTISKTGDFVVADEGGNRIMIFHSSGELKSKFACKCVIKDVTVTPKNDILVSVTGSGSAIMHLYDMKGRLISEFGQHYRFENPCGITCLHNGQVAVTGLETFSVLLFNDHYKYTGTTIGRKGSGDERFLLPCHVTTDNKNNVIVSDCVNHNIQVFTALGKFKHRFGGEGSNHSYLNTPLGIATDIKDNIIVADSNNYRVEVFSSKGRYLATVVKDTFEISPNVKPVKVAVTSKNHYVVLLVGTQYAEVRIYQPRPSRVTLSDVSSPDSCKTQ